MEYFFFGFVAACVLIAAIRFFHGQPLSLDPGQVRKISIGNMNFGEHEITKAEWGREKCGDQWGWEFRILAEPKFQRTGSFERSLGTTQSAAPSEHGHIQNQRTREN